MSDASGTPRDTGLHAGHTRAWIVAAFNRLVLSRRYRSVSVGEVSRSAGVGRSTFYEHFRDKDDVLGHALRPVLAPLADAAVGTGDVRSLKSVLEHVRENRDRTLELLKDDTREQIERALAALVLERIDNAQAADDAMRKLEAARLAGSQIAVLLTWLRQGASACPSETAAAALTMASPPRSRTDHGQPRQGVELTNH